VKVFDVLNEPEFVRLAVSGDADAFHRLFGLLARPLASYIERLGIPAADAEEVAADALAKVRRSLPTYRDRGAKLTTWIFEIARNCALDHHRSATRRATQHAEFCIEYARGNGHSADAVPVRITANAEAFSAAMTALSATDRDILRMREVMEYDEIARAEKATEQSVRVRHKRALDRLKQKLAPESPNV
jgi:RNA polymerase sigma-70 factor (ECF subfamily)